MKKPTVSPPSELHQRRLAAIATKDTDPGKLFDIPYDQLGRVSDGANESLSDRLAMSSEAAAAVRRLFDAFGIEGMPDTWGELAGAVAYCDMLHTLTASCDLSTAMGRSMLERSSVTLGETYPELVESLLAYQRGDLAAMQRISRERLTLPVMSRHFDTVDECWSQPGYRRAG